MGGLWHSRSMRGTSFTFAFAVAAAATLVAGLAAQSPAPKIEDIRQFQRDSREFCTAGQPTLEQIAALKADGIKSVLNLRPASEYRTFSIDDEAKAVRAAGLKYFNIPVVYMSPTDANADEFLKITDDPANRPMFIQ